MGAIPVDGGRICVRLCHLVVELNRFAVEVRSTSKLRATFLVDSRFHKEEAMGVFRDAMEQALALRGLAPRTRLGSRARPG